MMSKTTTPIAEYSKISSKSKGGGLSSLVDVLASFAEGFLGNSMGSVDSEVVRGRRAGDLEVVVCESRSRPVNVCTEEAVVCESCGDSEFKCVVGTLSICEDGLEVIGGGREGVVGGDALSKLDVCGTTVTGSDIVVTGEWELVATVGILAISVVSSEMDIVVAGRVVEEGRKAVVGDGGEAVDSVVDKSRSTHVSVRDNCTFCLSQFLRVFEIAYRGNR